MKALLYYAAIFSTIGAVSCSKEEDYTITEQPDNDVENKVDRIRMNSSSYPIYAIDSSILGCLKHYCQSSAGGAVASSGCGPTSYMMAAYALAKYRDSNTQYECNTNKVKSIYNLTKHPTYSYVTLPSLARYGNNYDGSFISVSEKYTPDRELMKDFIKTSLENNRFVIVSITGYIYRGKSPVYKDCFYSLDESVNADLSPIGNTRFGSKPNYITSLDENGNDVGGHIILLVKFVQTAEDGSGYIEYIDPLARGRSNNNYRYVSFTRLLNSMRYNGTSSNYNALSIALK